MSKEEKIVPSPPNIKIIFHLEWCLRMRNLFILLFLLISLFGLTSCSHSNRDVLLRYEQSLVYADSLAQAGDADSARAVGLLSSLHQEYELAKELSGGRAVRMVPANRWKQIGWGTFGVLMLGLNAWLSVVDFNFFRERKHRSYLIELSENEQRLQDYEREREELEACLDEMSLTNEEREEVRQSLTNLMEQSGRLCTENESLRLRLKEYENRPVPREVEMLQKEGERIRQLDGQMQALTSALIDGDEVVQQLRNQPKFLMDDRWKYLNNLADKMYDGFNDRLLARFPRLTPADRQLCLLIRLRFTNVQIATFTAVSPATVSQQKFRLKKRMTQADGRLFADGETLDTVVCHV